MSSEFDGLRTILGNTAVAVPLLDAPAVEQHAAVPVASTSIAPPPVEPIPALAPSTPPAELPIQRPAVDPVVEAAAATEDLHLPSTSHALADIPGLSELDRGLERGDAHAHSDEHDNLSLDALGEGLDDTSSGLKARAADAVVGDLERLQQLPPSVAKPGSANAPLLNDPGSLEVDHQVFAGATTGGRQQPGWPRQPQVPSSRKQPTDSEERRINGWAIVAVMASCVVLGATAAAAVFHDDVSQIIASWGTTASTSHTRKAQ
jgi:hypothetical protein